MPRRQGIKPISVGPSYAEAKAKRQTTERARVAQVIAAEGGMILTNEQIRALAYKVADDFLHGDEDAIASYCEIEEDAQAIDDADSIVAHILVAGGYPHEQEEGESDV